MLWEHLNIKFKREEAQKTRVSKHICVCVSRMVSWKAKEERVQRRRTDCGILLEVR